MRSVRGLCPDTDKLRSWSRTGYWDGLTATADIAWTPRGLNRNCCEEIPGQCADAARMSSGNGAAIVRKSRRTYHRTLRVRCADTLWKPCGGSPEIRLTLFAHSATCRIILDKGMVSNQNAGFPIPESRADFVRLNVSKFVRGCADDKALNGRSETGSETERVGSEMNARRRSCARFWNDR